jgi:hypothetical protein
MGLKIGESKMSNIFVLITQVMTLLFGGGRISEGKGRRGQGFDVGV